MLFTILALEKQNKNTQKDVISGPVSRFMFFLYKKPLKATNSKGPATPNAIPSKK